jgi:hypothetical protein
LNARLFPPKRILLAADAGASDHDIATGVAVGGSTVYRTKRRFVEGNHYPQADQVRDPTNES